MEEMESGWMESENACLLPQATSIQAELLTAGDRQSSTSETEQPVSYLSDGESKARRAMYASHALSTWGERAWEFAVGLIVLELHPTSLILVSLFGLLDAAVLMVLGAAVGAYCDRTPRLRAACNMYVLQNSSVAVSAVASLVLLLDTSLRSGPAFYALVALAMAAGATSSLGSLGSTLSVEREWTKALCGQDSQALARLNAGMKRIDLTCLIASPIMVGLLMTFGGKEKGAAVAALAILAWNLVAWVPEAALLRAAQRWSPALSAPKSGRDLASDSGPTSHPPEPAKTGNSSGGGSSNRGGSGGAGGPLASLQQQCRAWGGYFRQGVAPAALALALLYLTVLSFGTLMTAYLKWRGMSEAELSIYRGCGALSGVLATMTFPALQRTLGLVPTGVGAIWAQLLCLLCATAPVLASLLGVGVSNRGVMLALVWGLVLSRFGLWTFDLVVNQLIQESVDSTALGSFNGVQGSMQSLFQMLAYAAGAVVWQPERFAWLMAGSCAMVATAAALYGSFAVLSRCGQGLAGMQPQQVATGLLEEEGAGWLAASSQSGPGKE